ncbi:T9SS type A sorting domain-containing protein [Bizionia sp. KMM 8389]
MRTKITIKSLLLNKSLKPLLVLALVFVTGDFFAQVTTDVFPSRITNGSTVSIVGTDFTESTSISISGISVSNRVFVSPTEMTFKISHSGGADVVGNLTVGGVATGLTVEYVAPTPKVLENGPTSNVTKVTEIFTTYNGFWRSSQWKADPSNLSLWPNTGHDLLAFTYDGVTYSTGVDDAVLTANGVSFDSQLFYAYTTNGVDGTTQSNNYLAMADLIDGEVNEGVAVTSPNVASMTIYDAIIDGVNGLNIGTGVTNFNQTSDVSFYSAGGQVGSVDDNMPDFLISQIASGGSTDLYYYADFVGNVVGRPIKITIAEQSDDAGDALLARWRLDLYRFDNGINYGLATPTERAFSSNETRPLRMVAFRMDEFEITSSNVTEINNINMVAGGTADLAFLAYNRGSFDIKTPVFDQFPVSRFVCKVPGTSDITFTATGVVSGGATGNPLETLSYQWYKYNTMIPGETNSTYTISGGVEEDDLAAYKVRITNGFGAVVASANLVQGGTPTFWDGSTWQLPPSYIAAGITVDDEDRNLVFSQNYNQSGVLEGCDCLVPSGSNVTIPSGSTLKLFKNVVVESGASLTLEDGASLIQTEAVTLNANVGSIIVEREATGLNSNDFVVWSSPVNGFDVSGITVPYVTSVFQYDINSINTNGTAGNYVAASGDMNMGEGYSVGVPDEFVATGFTAAFQGTPRNGAIDVEVYKSPTTAQPELENRNWNLIGNPYPSAINVDEFLANNLDLEGNVRLWSQGIPNTNIASTPFYAGVEYNYGDQYVTYNRTGSTPDVFDGNIASGQGFFVQVSESSPATSIVSFENSLRFDDAENAYDNSNFLSTSDASTVNNGDKNLVWLSLVDASNTSSVALIGYVAGATNGVDRLYDAMSDGNEMSIYSTVSNTKMAIQGRSLPFDETDLVPLGIDIPADGAYTIGIDHLNGDVFVNQGTGIYLEDTVMGVVHDLRVQPYSFTGTSGTSLDRFILRYTAPLSVDTFQQNDTFVFVNNNELQVKSSTGIKSVSVYDITGKQVVAYSVSGNNTRFTAPFNFYKGVYLSKIELTNGLVVTKKLIN